jgi:hypothetical protein
MEHKGNMLQLIAFNKTYFILTDRESGEKTLLILAKINLYK